MSHVSSPLIYYPVLNLDWLRSQRDIAIVE